MFLASDRDLEARFTADVDGRGHTEEEEDGGDYVALGRSDERLLGKSSPSSPVLDRRGSEEGVLVVNAMRPVLRLLCVLPAPRRADFSSRALYWLQLVVTAALVGWSMIGWWIRVGYVAAGRDMPPLAGWYEVSDSQARSAPSGLVLTTSTVSAWLYLRHIFSQPGFLKHLEVSSGHVAMLGTASEIARRYTRFAATYAVFAAVGGRTANILTDLASHGGSATGPQLRSWWLPLAFDWTVTLCSYAVQYGAVVMFWLIVSMLCYLHGVELKVFRDWMAKEEWTPEEVDRRYRSVVAPIEVTCRLLSSPIATLGTLVVLGGALVLLDLLFSTGTAHETVYAIRFIYVFLFLMPVGLGLWNAATLSSCFMATFKAAHTMRFRSAETTVFLSSYFSVAAADVAGFEILGMVLRRHHLVRAVYAVAIFSVSVFQARVSSK